MIIEDFNLAPSGHFWKAIGFKRPPEVNEHFMHRNVRYVIVQVLSDDSAFCKRFHVYELPPLAEDLV